MLKRLLQLGAFLALTAWCVPSWASWFDIESGGTAQWQNVEAGLTEDSPATGDLKKTGSSGWTNGNADADITFSGDGGCRHTIGTSGTALARMVGIDTSANHNNFTTIDFALNANSGGTLAVFQNGSAETIDTAHSYAIGEVLMIRREGTVVKAYVDGVLKHAFSNTPSASAMYCPFTLNHTNGTVEQAQIQSNPFPPVWQHGDGDSAISTAPGSSSGDVDVTWTEADKHASGTDPIKYEICHEAVLADLNWDIGSPTCEAAVTEASACSGGEPQSCTSTVTITEGATEYFVVRAVDSATVASDSDFDSTDTITGIGADVTAPVFQHSGATSQIAITAADQANALEIAFEEADDATSPPEQYVFWYNTVEANLATSGFAETDGTVRFPSTGYLVEQCGIEPDFTDTDTDADGACDLTYWLQGLDSATQYTVAIQACDSAPTPNCTTYSASDDATATTLTRLYMNAGDVDPTALTMRFDATGATVDHFKLYRCNNATTCTTGTADVTTDPATSGTSITGLTEGTDYAFLVTWCDDGACTTESSTSRLVVSRPSRTAAITKTTEGLVASDQIVTTGQYGLGAAFDLEGTNIFYGAGEDYSVFLDGARLVGTSDGGVTEVLDMRFWVGPESDGNYYRVSGAGVLAAYTAGGSDTIGTDLCAVDEQINFKFSDSVAGSDVEFWCGASGGTPVGEENRFTETAVTKIQIAGADAQYDEMILMGYDPTISISGLVSGEYLLVCDNAAALLHNAAQSGGVAMVTLDDDEHWLDGWLKVATDNTDCSPSTTELIGQLRSYEITMGSTWTLDRGEHAVTPPNLMAVKAQSGNIVVSGEQTFSYELEVKEDSASWPGVLYGPTTLAQVANGSLPVYLGVVAFDGQIPSTILTYRLVMNGESGSDFTFYTHAPDGTEGIHLCMTGSCFNASQLPYGLFGQMNTEVDLFIALFPNTMGALYIHLGDGIYEDGPSWEKFSCWNGSGEETNPTCTDEYTIKWTDAKGAPGVRSYFRTKNMIATLDDHEICDDYTRGGTGAEGECPVLGQSVTATRRNAGLDNYQAFVMDGNPAPLKAGTRFYTYSIGRVLYVVFDLISERNDTSATDNYNTSAGGTVSINTGSATLTGSGTTFTDGQVGDPIRLGAAGSCIYQLASITDATNATVTPNFGDCVGESNFSGAAYKLYEHYGDLDESAGFSKSMMGGEQFAYMQRALFNAEASGLFDYYVMVSSKGLFNSDCHAVDTWTNDVLPGYAAERDEWRQLLEDLGLKWFWYEGDHHRTMFHNAGTTYNADGEYTLMATGPGPHGYDNCHTATPSVSEGNRRPDVSYVTMETDEGSDCPGGFISNGVCIIPDTITESGERQINKGLIPLVSGDTYSFIGNNNNHTMTRLDNGTLVASRGRKSVVASDTAGTFFILSTAEDTGNSTTTDRPVNSVATDGTNLWAAYGSGTTTEGSNIRQYTVGDHTLTSTGTKLVFSQSAANLFNVDIAASTDGNIWVATEMENGVGGNQFLIINRCDSISSCANSGTTPPNNRVVLADGDTADKQASIVEIGGDTIAVAYIDTADSPDTVSFILVSATTAESEPKGVSFEGTKNTPPAAAKFDTDVTNDKQNPSVCRDGSGTAMVVFMDDDAVGMNAATLTGTVASPTRSSEIEIQTTDALIAPQCAYVNAAWYAAYQIGHTIVVYRSTDTTTWTKWRTIYSSEASVISIAEDDGHFRLVGNAPDATDPNLHFQLRYQPDKFAGDADYQVVKFDVSAAIVGAAVFHKRINPFINPRINAGVN